jgi:hypothetical protein
VEPGDRHPLGARARVLGSIGVEEMWGYFVEWEDLQGVAVFLASPKVREVPKAEQPS